MAAGDIVFFDQFKIDLGNKIHDLDSDEYKVGLITSSVTPTAASAAPHWGGTGTTNFATNQVTPGGNYASGGPAIGSLAYTDQSGTATWAGNKISIANDPSNPTDARWGIVYNNTDSNKRAVAFLDLGSVRDLSQADPVFEFRF